jgi:hypothetical protein
MNADQIKHIASVFSLIAFAEFGAFGYTAIEATPIGWSGLAISGLIFMNLQAFAVWVLSFLKEEVKKP